MKNKLTGITLAHVNELCALLGLQCIGTFRTYNRGQLCIDVAGYYSKIYIWDNGSFSFVFLSLSYGCPKEIQSGLKLSARVKVFELLEQQGYDVVVPKQERVIHSPSVYDSSFHAREGIRNNVTYRDNFIVGQGWPMVWYWYD